MILALAYDLAATLPPRNSEGVQHRMPFLRAELDADERESCGPVGGAGEELRTLRPEDRSTQPLYRQVAGQSATSLFTGW